MPVISCRSGTALLIYFKVSFRTVCLISTLHGAALPKGGKAPLPGKLVFFFPQHWMPSASSHQILERGTVHLKEAGWLGQQQSWLLPAAAVGVLGMLRRGAGTREVPGLQRTVVTACV